MEDRDQEEAAQGADKAFEGRETQAESRAEDGFDVAPARGTDKVGETVTKGGEERGAKKSEPGREDDEGDTGHEEHGGAARPSGTSSARFSTGVAPEREEPIEGGPNTPSGDQGG